MAADHHAEVAGGTPPTTRRFVYVAAEKEWLGLLDDESLEEQVRDQMIGLGFTSVSVDVFDPYATGEGDE